MKNNSTKKGASRTRNYATIVYPDSQSFENLYNLLTECHVPALISPLHDFDIDHDGNLKKPHYHVLIMYDSVKTMAQANELIDSIKGVGVQVVNSIRGYARYLCHLDNPEKAQYNIEDVTQLNGANYIEIISLTIDRLNDISEMIDFIDEWEILSFSELTKFSRTYKRDSWFRTLTESSAYFIKEYLKSKKWESETQYESKLHILLSQLNESK